MNCFNKNIEAIKDCHPYLYKELKAHFEQEIVGIESIEECKLDTGFELEYAQADNGEAVLYIEKQGSVYRLNSAYDPEYEAKKWAEQFDDHGYCSVMQVFGLGTGVFLEELVKKFPKDTLIMVYEPSIKILIHTLYFCDLTSLLKNDNLYLTFGSSDLEEYELVLRHCIGRDTIGYQSTIVTPCYDKVFLEAQRDWLSVIKKANTKIRMNLNTLRRFGRMSAINSIANMKHSLDNYDFLALRNVVSEDMPVILVAAGPSLDNNIEFLKKAKGKALIVAVDRALNPLLEHGIIPDFSSTLDPVKPLVNYQHPLSLEVPLIYIPEANPKILDAHKGKKFLVPIDTNLNSNLLKEVGYEPELINVGGSVATATFSTLVKVGFKTIILVGQDLCIYGNHTHALAAEKDNESTVPSMESLIKVKGNNGGIVNTRHDFLYYIEWYNESIKNLSDQYTVINATEGGAFIEGTKIMSLYEAIETYCKEDYDIAAILDSIPKAIQDKERLTKVVNDMYEQLVTMKKYTKEAIDISYDLIANAVQKSSNNNKAKKLENKLKDINDKILEMKMYAVVDGLISSDIQYELNGINVFSDNEYDDARKTYDYSRTLYESMLVAIDDLKSQVEILRTDVIV